MPEVSWAQPWGYGGAAFPSGTPPPVPLQSPPVLLHQLQRPPRPGSRWGVVNENDSGASLPALPAADTGRSGTIQRRSRGGDVDAAGLESGGVASFPAASLAGEAAAAVGPAEGGGLHISALNLVGSMMQHQHTRLHRAGASFPSFSHGLPRLPHERELQVPPLPLPSAALAVGHRPSLSTAVPVATATAAFDAVLPSQLGGSLRFPVPEYAPPSTLPPLAPRTWACRLHGRGRKLLLQAALSVGQA